MTNPLGASTLKAVLRLALVVLLAAVLLPAAAGSSTSAPRSYAFGRHGGNIRPWTARISTTGKVTVTGDARRTRTGRPAARHDEPREALRSRPLLRAAGEDPLPQAAPGLRDVLGHRDARTKTHTVDGQLGCWARFDSIFGTLRNVSRVKS